VHDGLKWANSKGVHSVVDLCEGEVGVDGNGGGGDLGLTMGFRRLMIELRDLEELGLLV